MSLYIIGIDGLDLGIINKYISELPNFSNLKKEGYLKKIETVFPADSVPAWSSIFTGLNPAEHGIIRGKDYVETVEDYTKHNKLEICGKTFWDKLSSEGKRCLILNPFLAYPSWPINGTMISGPSFVEGNISKYPSTINVLHDTVYGGYGAIGGLSSLHSDMADALQDISNLWDETKFQMNKEKFDLVFVTFTTLDRIQHYSWRFYDENDPLHEYDSYLSNIILYALKKFDQILSEVLSLMSESDSLLLISDHGFGQRPYNLINLNELLRREGLLTLNKNSDNYSVKMKQKVRNYTIRILSSLKLLDTVVSKIKKIPGTMKYKKSDHLIDKDYSICYTDELFCGKKPYIGLNFGNKIKGNKMLEQKTFEQIMNILDKSEEFPKYIWAKRNFELYKGKFSDRLPDICIELPKEFGIEYDLFGDIQTKSVTHYKISGGHFSSGTLGIFPNTKVQPIKSVEEFSSFVLSIV